jgi:hypothetical protein
MTTGATDAAEALAAVLQAEATNLASDDVAVIADSMASVRRAARELEAALRARGWGGNVLYGFGESLDDDLPDDGDLELDDFDDEEEDDEPWSVPAGTKVTYQARFDFVVVDPSELLTYVSERLGDSVDADYFDDHDPFFTFAELEGFSNKDLSGTGLAFAGGQEASHTVEKTLWEMDADESSDQYPSDSL